MLPPGAIAGQPEVSATLYVECHKVETSLFVHLLEQVISDLQSTWIGKEEKMISKYKVSFSHRMILETKDTENYLLQIFVIVLHARRQLINLESV